MKKTLFLLLLTLLLGSVSPAFADEPKKSESIGGEIFGIHGGYIHPSITIGGEYSDNIYNTRNDRRDDFIWTISPEIWVALPGTRKKAMALSVSPKTPAGFTLSRKNPEAFRRYKAYLGYGADIYRYRNYTDENRENHKLEGLLQYNFRGGLSLELIDQYVHAFDPVGVAPFTRHDEYTENLFNGIATYEVTDKFKVRLDFTHTDIDYKDRPAGEYPLPGRNRKDNGYAGYLFFKIRPKTSVFAQYQFIAIDYDENILADDSEERIFFGGITWKMTARSQGRFKIGYGEKDFADAAIKDNHHLFLEGAIHHSFTPKTGLSLVGFRRTDETTIAGTRYVLTHGVTADYTQRFTEKLTGHLHCSYAWDQYQEKISFDGETREREDDLIRFRPSLRYAFTRWLRIDAAYMYSRRNSNFNIFDFAENRFFLRLSLSLHRRQSGIPAD